MGYYGGVFVRAEYYQPYAKSVVVQTTQQIITVFDDQSAGNRPTTRMG